MAVETRTVHFRIDPALRAYVAWLDSEGREFDLEDYDLFAAGYRARVAEEDDQPGRATAGEGDGRAG
jgi:hypothetical protein